MKFKVFIFVLFASFIAEAGVCIQINSENDTLMPNEQNAAKFIAEKEFQSEGAVIDGTCTETYTLTHLLLGSSIIVVMEKGGNRQSVVIEGKDELAKAYNQLARYFLKGISANYKNTTTENVIGTQAEPPRKIGSELNFIMMLGYGIQPTPDIGGGINWTLGLRYDLRYMFLDFEFGCGLWDAHGPDYLELNLVGFKGAYYFSEKDPASWYIGAGIRAGFYFLDNDDYDYDEDTAFSGSGVISIGHEWLRNSSKRFMVQFDAKFPFHSMKLENETYNGGQTIRETKRFYFPTLSINLGVGL
jgi:hypothetical protein